MLGIIAFLPYPTQLLSVTSTNQTAALVFYAVCAGAAGLAEAAVWALGGQLVSCGAMSSAS